MQTAPMTSPPPWARLLGLAGLLPFVAGAVATWAFADPVASARAAFALTAYAATIAAFLGGVNWAPALRAGGRDPAPLILGVLPQLLGWLALLMPTRASLLLSSIALAGCYAIDRHLYPQGGLSAWLSLRLQLTVIAVMCCILAAAVS